MLQPWTCCLLCVQPETPRLSIITQVSPCVVPGSCSRRGRHNQATLFLFCSLLCFRHLKQGVSPATCKISYQTVQSLLSTPRLQKFIPAKILLITQVTCWKTGWKSALREWASGLRFYLLSQSLSPRECYINSIRVIPFNCLGYRILNFLGINMGSIFKW